MLEQILFLFVPTYNTFSWLFFPKCKQTVMYFPSHRLLHAETFNTHGPHWATVHSPELSCTCLHYHVCFDLSHVLSPPMSCHWLSPLCFPITLTCFQFAPWLVGIFNSSLFSAKHCSVFACLTLLSCFVLCCYSLVFNLILFISLCILFYCCHCCLQITWLLPVYCFTISVPLIKRFTVIASVSASAYMTQIGSLI